MSETTTTNQSHSAESDQVESNRTSVHPMTPFRPGALSNSKRPAGSIWLRWVLVFIDTEAIFLAWAIALVFYQRVPTAGRSSTEGAIITMLLTLGGLILLATQELYLARVSSIRAVEMTRIFRTAVLLGFGAGLGAEIFDANIAAKEAGLGALLSVTFLIIGRSSYRAWLTSLREAGEHRRSVVVIGTNDEAKRLYDLLGTHTEIGLEVAAVYGDAVQAEANGLGHLYRGRVSESVSYVTTHPVSGVIIATTNVDTVSLNRIVRELLSVGVHIQLTSGLQGIASRRLRAQPLAHEPMIYLEQLTLAWWQLALKRSIDIVLSLCGLIVAAPIIGVLALGVKISDRGPAFFKQRRIGRNGEPFDMIKVRTMVVDAEARLEALRKQTNERSGPLFKMDHDPRFTRIGRFMDLSSLNELPQLWNVLRGDMSLVGPRPALPREAARFDPELHARNLVRPGITGLWQVEARDNPDFSAYKRLDLHYVENWSVAFDMIIILQTVESIVSRLLKAVTRGSSSDGKQGSTSFDTAQAAGAAGAAETVDTPSEVDDDQPPTSAASSSSSASVG
jgi:exopolysaccharide biosynthesis polyprenyl glycosylphosphotransferase